MDAGIAVVQGLFDRLLVDPEWSVEQPRGFTWWPHRHAQRVWADDPIDGGEAVVSVVHVETDLVQGAEQVDASADVLDLWLSIVGGSQALGGLVRNGDRVSLHSTAAVHSGNSQWLLGVLQVAALLQAINAERSSLSFEQAMPGLTPATSSHPTSGERIEPDELLDALPLPDSTSHWGTPAEFEEITDYLVARGVVATQAARGLTAEIPIRDQRGSAVDGTATNLLTVAAASHPTLGEGLHLRLSLLTWPWSDDMELLPVRLNQREVAGDSNAHLLGTWAVDDPRQSPGATPYFSCWLPTVLHRPGILANMVLAMAVRARWVSSMQRSAPRGPSAAEPNTTRARARTPSEGNSKAGKSWTSAEQLRSGKVTGVSPAAARWVLARTALLSIADSPTALGHAPVMAEMSRSNRTSGHDFRVECSCGVRWQGPMDHVRAQWLAHQHKHAARQS